jgi:flagellar biosynthesis/type III secretory pathway chaperone
MQTINTPKDVINDLNTLFFKFLWNNKSEKIKRNTLIGNRFDGGLCMIDIEAYAKSMKSKFVKTLTDNQIANWKIIPTFFLNQYGTNLLVFRMNIDTFKSLPKTRIVLPTFYKSLLETWIDIKYVKSTSRPSTFYEIRKQVLWGNCNIKLNSKCLIFHTWIKSGIIFVNDILDDSGNINAKYIFEKLKDKHNWISEIHKLKNAIPKEWQGILKSEASKLTKVTTTLSVHINKLAIQDLTNKYVYQLLVKRKFVTPYLHTYWNSLFNTDTNWTNLYLFINKALIDNRVKQYRYKLIHNIIATNENLFKWRISTSPNCITCGSIETLQHFFIDCNYISNFWTHILNTLEHCGVANPLNKLKYIILGYKIYFKECNLLNVLLSYIGFAIYKGYYISERRSKLIDITKLLRSELLVITNYYKKHNIPYQLLRKFLEQL